MAEALIIIHKTLRNPIASAEHTSGVFADAYKSTDIDIALTFLEALMTLNGVTVTPPEEALQNYA